MKRLMVYVDMTPMETGIWCDTCLPPSGQAFEATPMSMNGVGRTQRFSDCPNCGQPTAPERSQ